MVDLVALKDLLQPIFPLLGVVVGAATTGFGQIYKAHKERKRIIALALSDLLEVRHRVVMLNEAIRFIQCQAKDVQISGPHLRNLLEELIPADTALDARFDEAVTLLAGIDPVFAFELRSKNHFPLFLKKLRQLALSMGDNLPAFEATEKKLIEAITPTLDEAVLKVAKHHSRRVLKEVTRVVALKDNLDSRMGPIWSLMKP